MCTEVTKEYKPKNEERIVRRKHKNDNIHLEQLTKHKY